jgi:PAS domain S-box-containing protein
VEQRLGEPEELHRQLVERSPDGILLIQDGRIALLNHAAARLFGCTTPDRFRGMPLLEIFHPDSHVPIQDGLKQLLAGRAIALTEAKVVCVDGTVTDVEAVGSAIEDGGRSIRIVLRDISKRKQTEAALRESEERLTMAFAGAQEGVFDWNLETGAVVYSARWKEMLGYSDEEIEPHVSAWERLLHPDDRPRARELDLSLTRGMRTYEGEFRLRHKDGHYVHVLSRGLPVRREPGGPVVRIVGTHFDLTERKRAEELLRRAHEELEGRVRERTAELALANDALRDEIGQRELAERARTELHARLAFAQEDERRRIAREMHDQFGEQLTALELGIAMLKTACGDRPDLRAQVEALEAVAQQLDRDIEHLVWELRPTALDDLGLRAALTNYVQNWSKRVGIHAQLHTSGLLDDRLSSEAETTLYRIAQEALTNVAKHSRAANVEVILERRSDHVLLIVEDDGVGFDYGEASAAGRGFGLQGMQERAALGGASLEIESAAGKGTTILVRMASTTQGSAAALGKT